MEAQWLAVLMPADGEKEAVKSVHYRWLLVVVAALVVQGLATACGGGAGEGSPTAQPTLTPTGTATVQAEATPTGTAAPTPEPSTLDLATSPPILTVFAADAGDLRSDIPALAVGDFNGDNIGDLLIGARFGDGPGTGTSCDDGQAVGDRCQAGEAYVIFGSSTLGGTVDIAQNQQNFTIFGAKPGDNLGFSVASGDVNGDGIDDIVVGAPFSNGPANERTDLGEVYVIFGSSGLGGTVDIAQGQQDVRITAAEGFALLGDSLSIDDVNGDGIADIVAGAPFAGRIAGAPVGGPRTETGEVYVIFGSPTLGGSVSIARDEQNFTIAGFEQFGELGDSVATGDINGDGIADIIVAAEAADGPDGSRPNAGVAYVIFGSDALAGKASLADGEQDLSILGAEPQDTLGFSMASGDVNGDGIDDVILAARLADGPGNARSSAGEVYVIFGSPGLAGTVDTALGEENVTIVAANAHHLLGSVASGDLNGDGIDDIVVGTRHAGAVDLRTLPTGKAYVVLGSPSLDREIDIARGDQHLTIAGAQAGDGLGAVVRIGDMNGDGVNELVLIADGADGPEDTRPDAGEVYVVDGYQALR